MTAHARAEGSPPASARISPRSSYTSARDPRLRSEPVVHEHREAHDDADADHRRRSLRPDGADRAGEEAGGGAEPQAAADPDRRAEVHGADHHDARRAALD